MTVKEQVVAQFDSYEEWVCRDLSSLGIDFRVVDSEGRNCDVTEDFIRARDEKSFPLYVWGNHPCAVCKKKLDDRTVNFRMNKKKLIRLCNECAFDLGR